MSKQQIYKIIETIVLALLTCCAVALGMTSCKAWRTITTTATYSAAPDKSGNPVTTIQTKTTEEYTGVKKNWASRSVFLFEVDEENLVD